MGAASTSVIVIAGIGELSLRGAQIIGAVFVIIIGLIMWRFSIRHLAGSVSKRTTE